MKKELQDFLSRDNGDLLHEFRWGNNGAESFRDFLNLVKEEIEIKELVPVKSDVDDSLTFRELWNETGKEIANYTDREMATELMDQKIILQVVDQNGSIVNGNLNLFVGWIEQGGVVLTGRLTDEPHYENNRQSLKETQDEVIVEPSKPAVITRKDIDNLLKESNKEIKDLDRFTLTVAKQMEFPDENGGGINGHIRYRFKGEKELRYLEPEQDLLETFDTKLVWFGNTTCKELIRLFEEDLWKELMDLGVEVYWSNEYYGENIDSNLEILDPNDLDEIFYFSEDWDTWFSQSLT